MLCLPWINSELFSFSHLAVKKTKTFHDLTFFFLYVFGPSDFLILLLMLGITFCSYLPHFIFSTLSLKSVTVLEPCKTVPICFWLFVSSSSFQSTLWRLIDFFCFVLLFVFFKVFIKIYYHTWVILLFGISDIGFCFFDWTLWGRSF